MDRWRVMVTTAAGSRHHGTHHPWQLAHPPARVPITTRQGPVLDRLTSCASTPSARWRWTRCSRRTRATPARRWRWRRSPTRCGRTSCGTTRRDPAWPNRDRFVLSCGHASMLLYSLLHLAGRAGATAGQPRRAVDARRHQALPPARQPLTPAIPSTADRRASRPRPARSARARQQRRHGDRRALAGGALQPARVRAVRLQRLRAVQRRRHDGGRVRRGRVARRPPQALEPVLDLRRQPASRSKARTDLAFSEDVGSRASPPTAGRFTTWPTPTTATRSRAALDSFRQTDDRPTLIVVRSHIGYGAPHKQDTREAHGEPLGEEEVAPRQAQLRLARGRASSSSPTASTSASATVSAAAAGSCARRGRRLAGALPERARRSRRRARPDAAARAARGLGPGRSRASRRRQGHGQPRQLGQGAERHCAARAVADRRLGGPGALDQDAADLRGGRRLRGRQLRRPQLAFRHPRARDGRHLQRHGADRCSGPTARAS